MPARQRVAAKWRAHAASLATAVNADTDWKEF
jgi:hypothetical protein